MENKTIQINSVKSLVVSVNENDIKIYEGVEPEDGSALFTAYHNEFGFIGYFKNERDAARELWGKVINHKTPEDEKLEGDSLKFAVKLLAVGMRKQADKLEEDFKHNHKRALHSGYWWKGGNYDSQPVINAIQRAVAKS